MNFPFLDIEGCSTSASSRNNWRTHFGIFFGIVKVVVEVVVVGGSGGCWWVDSEKPIDSLS
jgi:hypothetical protein